MGAAGDAHGFPAVLTSLVGRAGPVREVAGLLEGHRLVTVTGPGGAGRPGCPVRWPGGWRAGSPTGRGCLSAHCSALTCAYSPADGRRVPGNRQIPRNS